MHGMKQPNYSALDPRAAGIEKAKWVVAKCSHGRVIDRPCKPCLRQATHLGINMVVKRTEEIGYGHLRQKD